MSELIGIEIHNPPPVNLIEFIQSIEGAIIHKSINFPFPFTTFKKKKSFI